MRGILFGIVVVFLAATPAAAAIDYGGQSRQVATITGPNGGPGTSDLKDTNATGFWSETAASGYSDTNGSASASASQTSNLGDLEISISGDLAAASDGHIAFALSQLGVTFTTDADLYYVSALDATTEVLTFTFVAGGGTVSYDANSNGVLPAGVYSIEAEFRAYANTAAGISSASGQYSYDLTLAPEPSTVGLSAVGALLMLAAAPKYRRRRS
jgi:hypothetical protein